MSVKAARGTRRPAINVEMRTAVIVLVVMVAGVLLAATPVSAEHDCQESRVELPAGGYQIVRVCPPHQEQNDGGGGSGGSGVTCQQFVRLDGTGGWDEKGRVLRPVVHVCSDGSESARLACIPALNPDPPGPACDSGEPPDYQQVFDGLLQRAAARVDIPAPGLRHTFDQPADDGTIRAIVRAETWWWSDTSQEPVSVTDEDGPVRVRVTATPGDLRIDPGDGSATLTCSSQLAYNHNVSYYDQVPGEPRGACVHIYEDVFDKVTATMSVTWTVTYEGSAPGLGAVSGSLGPQTREETATFPVKEIQSVVVR